jgi:hypothetical protein
MNQNHQLNPTEFSRPRLISSPPQTKKQTKLRTKSAKKSRYDTSSSESDSESDNDDDNETDKSSYDSSDSTSKLSFNTKQKLIEPSSMRPFILQSRIPILTFTIDQDVRFFIEDMTAYLRHNSDLSRQDQVQIVRSSIKGTAHEVL